MALSPQDAARTHAAMRCAPSPQPSIFPSDFRLHHHTHAALRATHEPLYYTRSVAPWQVALLIGCALTASSPRCRHSRRSLRGAAGRWLARPQCPIFQASGRRPTSCCRVPTRRRPRSTNALLCASRRSARAARCRPRGAAGLYALQAAAASEAERLARLRALSDITFCILLCALSAMSCGFYCLRVMIHTALLKYLRVHVSCHVCTLRRAFVSSDSIFVFFIFSTCDITSPSTPLYIFYTLPNTRIFRTGWRGI